MSNGDLNWITNFIWGIADDVLRDLYVRGKYRDVILPMTVLRRLDAVLEPTKQAVLDLKAALDGAGDRSTRTKPSGARQGRPSSTPRSLPSAISGPGPASSGSGQRPPGTARVFSAAMGEPTSYLECPQSELTLHAVLRVIWRELVAKDCAATPDIAAAVLGAVSASRGSRRRCRARERMSIANPSM